MDVTKVYVVFSSAAEGIVSTWRTESEAISAASNEAARLAVHPNALRQEQRRVGERLDDRGYAALVEELTSDGYWHTIVTVQVVPQEVQGSAIMRLAELVDDA